MICPFLSAERIVKEVKCDATGKVIDQKETPRREMVECLKKECYMFDHNLSACSLLAMPVSSESLKTLVRFTRELREAFASVQEATSKGIEEQIKITNSMKETQADGSAATHSAVGKLEEELKALARITSDVRRGIETLQERFESSVNRAEETAKGLVTNLSSEIVSQAAVIKGSLSDSSRLLEESVGQLTEKIVQASAASSKMMAEKLEAHGDRVRAVAGDSAETVREGLEKLAGRLVDAQSESSRELLAKLEEEGSAGKDATLQSAQSMRDGFASLADGLTRKLDEHCSRVTVSAEETADKLSEALERHCEKVNQATESLGRTMMEGVEAEVTRTIEGMKEAYGMLRLSIEDLARKTAEVGTEWKESLSRGVERLLGGIEEEKRALDLARAESQKLLSSISSSIVDSGRRSEDAFREFAARFQELRAETGARAEAQLGEQRKAVSSFESFSGALSRLSGQIESITEKISQSNKEMREFVQAVRDERDEEKRRAKLDEARAHNDKGVALYFRKSYTGAMEEFEKAIELDPTMAEAHSNMALCLTSLGKNDEAAESFKRALKIAPDMAETYNNLGLYHFKKKDYEQALAMFQEAVKKREDYPNAYLNLGSAYRELAMYDKALAVWEHVLKLDPGNQKAREAIDETRGA